MSNKNKSTWSKFSLEFKQDAARLVMEKDYTQQEALDHLGVSSSPIGRWVRAERPSVAALHSVSINLSYRITLEMIITEKQIVLLNVGSHDEVYQT